MIKESCSIITALAPCDHRWPLWIHHLSVLHLPAPVSSLLLFLFNASMGVTSHSIISFLFDRSWWKKKKSPYCAGTLGWRGWAPRGQLQAHTDITSCLSRRRYKLIPSHMCQCPAGWLWSWLPTALLLPPGSDTTEASPGSDTSEGHNFSQIKAAKPPSSGASNAIGCPLTSDLSHEGWKEKIKPLLTVVVEGWAAAWLWSKGWYESIKSAWDLFLFLSLSFRLSLTISRCQGDVAGQQPKGNRIRHGKVKTERLTHLSLPHTYTHNSSSEPWAWCCKSPEIPLDFLFSSDSEHPDSLPWLYPSHTLHFSSHS